MTKQGTSLLQNLRNSYFLFAILWIQEIAFKEAAGAKKAIEDAVIELKSKALTHHLHRLTGVAQSGALGVHVELEDVDLRVAPQAQPGLISALDPVVWYGVTITLRSEEKL